MDFRDPKQQKIILGAVAFLMIVYFWYIKVYEKYDFQISNRTQEFETVTTNLRNVEMKAKSLDALQIEYEDLVKRYDKIEALLPEVKQIPSLLVQLHTASSITGTTIKKIKPIPVAPEEFYNVNSFEIEMAGGYHEFASFISYVANFPFIANVSAVRINANNVAISKAADEEGIQNLSKRKETINAVFTLSTYFVQESERLQELEF